MLKEHKETIRAASLLIWEYCESMEFNCGMCILNFKDGYRSACIMDGIVCQDYYDYLKTKELTDE